ncbi:hypothetical protein DPEC_G00313540 [Dallia pectoralis]|uniref:Uncharacterized protein n=1 Tax=Dallia pectoralis TaxID=75939 RepID=A0ACC2FBY6_DALPE|nr:hypothetical protein DPEC_G00313540 [Dallia pectoralis]
MVDYSSLTFLPKSPARPSKARAPLAWTPAPLTEVPTPNTFSLTPRAFFRSPRLFSSVLGPSIQCPGPSSRLLKKEKARESRDNGCQGL